MENLALISPNALNLFLTGNTHKQSPHQQQDPEMLNRLNDIESEFERMVHNNEKEMREKEEFYREQLTRLKQEKSQEQSEKSNLQEQLMLKTIESATLKSKNDELEKLKRKLAQYQNEKERRKKARESMLLDADESPPLPAQNSPPIYSDIVVEEVEGADEILRDSIRESVVESLLLPSEPLQEHYYHPVKEKASPTKKKIQFAFRRIYNIKIAWEEGSVASEE